MKMNFYRLISLSVLMCGLVVSAMAAEADVAPLYFTKLGSSADENHGAQLERWNQLMKYKLWGTHRLNFANNTVSIADNTGYNGTADGNLTIRYNWHHIGGPTLVGGDFEFIHSEYDSLSMGPVRVLGDLQVSNQSQNQMEGDWCVQGNVYCQYGDGAGCLNAWNNIVTGQVYSDDYSLSKRGGDYAECPPSVPELDTQIEIPVWPTPPSWEPGIRVGSNYPREVYFIHVPPDSVETNAYGTYDKYIESFFIGGSTQKKVFILMPPGGKLTRIFSRDGFTFDNGANDLRLQVAYIHPGVPYDRENKRWDIEIPASKANYPEQPANGSFWEFNDYDKFDTIQNVDYAGNVLFYTTKDISWNYWVDANFQGSWMSTGTIHVGGHFKLAGQVLGNYLDFDAEVAGDFRYVPFNPPQFNPELFAGREYEETDVLEEIPFELDRVPFTNVSFKYCFSFVDDVQIENIDSSQVDADGVKIYDTTFIDNCKYGEGHCADVKDLRIINGDLPVCGTDTGYVLIPAGSTVPTDSAQKAWIRVKIDGLVEETERMNLNIIDLSGAVISYNDVSYFNSSISVGISIKNVDNPNFDPRFDDDCDTLKVLENVPGAVAGVVSATDIESDATALRYYITDGNGVDFFELDAETGVVKLKDGVSLDYENVQGYWLEISVYDPDGGFAYHNFGIPVIDVNEKPTIDAQTFYVRENRKNGATVGQVVKGDIDTLNAKTLEQEFVKHNIFLVDGGDSAVFDLNPANGFITVKNADLMDYEKDSILTLDVRVRDTSVYVLDPSTGAKIYSLEDMTTITIKLINDDDRPKIDSTTTDINVGDDTTTTETYKNLVNLDKKNKGAVDENNPANVIVGAVRATCTDTTKALYYEIVEDTSGLFTMDPKTGVVSIKDPMVLDYEQVTSYEIEVKVSDGVVVGTTGKDANGVTVQSDSRKVVIRVNDLNENPVVEKQNYHVAENRQVGTDVGTVVSSDLDSAAGFKVHTYEAVGGDSALFAIDANGKITTKQVLDFEAYAATGDTVFTLIVKVKDSKPAKDGSELFAIDTMSITLTDDNEPPVIVTDTVTVAENTAGGTFIDSLESTDPDGDVEILTYTMVGTSEYVDLTPDGSITVKTGANIDYEKVQSTVITVIVTDAGGLVSPPKDVVVVITDVNEPPSISDQSYSVKEDAKVGSTVGEVKASDPDVKTPEYSHLTYTNITPSDKFEVLDNGVIKLIDSLDYEKDSVYVLKVEVSDGTYADTATVTIKVTNVIEKSTVKITEAENTDSTWRPVPDTIYTNLPDMDLEWEECVEGRVPCNVQHGDTTLKEGVNVIIKKFKDPSTDVAGYDTLVVFLSTATPIVTISKSADPEAKVNIYTIEENVDAKDSAIFFVNSTKHDVTVTVKDPVTNAKESFTLKLDLDTLSIPSGTFKKMDAIADATLPLKDNPANVLHTPINGEKIAVSYKDIYNGDTVTITYFTDMKGNVLKGESAEEEMTVTYETVIDGKKVNVSFQADAITGHAIENPDGGLYTIDYEYVDKKKNSVNVSYTVNEKGKLVKNSSGDLGYEVSYTYVNKYGNSATQSLSIVLDTKPPLVWIKSPVEDQVLTSNMAEVEWYVSATGDTADFVLQDTLRIQGLEKGGNTIIRFFVDKAGNTAADTVYVIMKDAKDVEISVEKPVTFVKPDKVKEYYAASGEPKDGQTFAVSIKNPLTGKEKETKIGGSFKTKSGSGKAPYPGHSHHLGPTLGIDVKLPVYNSVGGLATMDDLLGKDGLVALDGVDAENSAKMPVSEYVKEYCSAEFASTYDKDYSKANLYNTTMNVQIWVYTTLGSFVDYFSFDQELNDAEYVDEAGMLKMYFEMKPDKEGYVRTESGRLYATGAYVYKTEVEMKSTLNCTLPPVNSDNPNQKVGAKRKTSEDLLKTFGYKRPYYGEKK